MPKQRLLRCTVLNVAKLQFVSEVEVGCSSVNVELLEVDAMGTLGKCYCIQEQVNVFVRCS